MFSASFSVYERTRLLLPFGTLWHNYFKITTRSIRVSVWTVVAPDLASNDWNLIPSIRNQFIYGKSSFSTLEYNIFFRFYNDASEMVHYLPVSTSNINNILACIHRRFRSRQHRGYFYFVNDTEKFGDLKAKCRRANK